MAGQSQKPDPLSHVLDHHSIEIPWWSHSIEEGRQLTYTRVIELPSVAGLQVTKFMVMELVAALLMMGILLPVVRHIRRTPVSRGWFMNMFEAILLFIRNEVARPAIGGHEADRFLPFLWTVFFFILFNNLLGMIPGGASATGNINVTAVLAVMTFGIVLAAGIREAGVAGFFVGLVPHLDVPRWMQPALWGLMFGIEVAGLLVRHIVLAIRLFANMFAGHMVLAVILGFILMAYSSLAFYFVAPASVVSVIGLSLLELFVAFLQAYIFTFLSALFIGMAVHPH